MKLNQTVKFIGIAFLGGLMAQSISWLSQEKPSQSMVMQEIVNEQSTHTESVPISQTNIAEIPRELDFIGAADKSLHAVVYILSEFSKKSSVYDDYFNSSDFFSKKQPNVFKASGSGVIISSDGYIVTNNHVVQDADKVVITLNDKRQYIATIVGTDPSTDLALLKIEEADLPYLIFGNSDAIQVGEWVLAVGNPFNLTSTVTAGIISAKARNINILGSQTSIESFLQTDAVVNRGNSGGALVDTKGKLVGINAAIASGTGYYTGYSFAIPAAIAKKVVKDLKEFGEVKRAYIGITIQNLDSKLAKEMNLKDLKGVVVAGVIHGGAAEKAGKKPKSIVTKIDGMEVNSGSELLEKIGRHRPGDKVLVSVKKDEKVTDHEVVLTDLYGNANIKNNLPDVAINEKIGAHFSSVNSKTKQALKINNGVEVLEIKEGLFKDAGIKAGFIITKIDQKAVAKPEDILKILNTKKGGVLIEGIYPNGVKAYYGFGI